MKYCPVCGDERDDTDLCPKDSAVLLKKLGAPDPLIGALFNDTYRITERIAQGGMGVVYRATQEPTGRVVALKVLLPELHRDERMVKRFFRETEILAELSHPNIVHMLDRGTTSHGLFLVMELLQGKPLDGVVPKGEGLPVARIVGIMRQMCSGMAEAHRHNLVHRDLKPSNIFVLDKDEVRILDFGIAKPLGDVDSKLTQAGLIMGTPGFIAPEQITGAIDADQRADVYALGAILYYLVAGRSPYAGSTPQSIISKQITQPPDAISFEPLGKPRELESVIWKAMELEPARRFQSVAELSQALSVIS